MDKQGPLRDVCFILPSNHKAEMAMVTVILTIAHIIDVAVKLHSLLVNLACCLACVPTLVFSSVIISYWLAKVLFE